MYFPRYCYQCRSLAGYRLACSHTPAVSHMVNHLSRSCLRIPLCLLLLMILIVCIAYTILITRALFRSKIYTYLLGFYHLITIIILRINVCRLYKMAVIMPASAIQVYNRCVFVYKDCVLYYYIRRSTNAFNIFMVFNVCVVKYYIFVKIAAVFSRLSELSVTKPFTCNSVPYCYSDFGLLSIND